ncbi:hypothetical protein GJ496_003002, partial [Pomphorhynchus laevis]
EERNITERIAARKEYAIDVSRIPDNNLVFLDETGFNEYLKRYFGYSPINNKQYTIVPANKGINRSVICAINSKGIIEYQYRQGSYNANLFIEFLRCVVVPYFSRNPTAIIVMDNARIDKTNALIYPHVNRCFLADVGDCVIAFNSRRIALPNEMWRTKQLSHHNKYARTHRMVPLPEIHDNDPTRLLRMATQSQISHLDNKRIFLSHLFIYPDDKIPKEMLKNVTFQLQGPNRIPRTAENYNEHEINQFPRVSQFPDHMISYFGIPIVFKYTASLVRSIIASEINNFSSAINNVASTINNVASAINNIADAITSVASTSNKVASVIIASLERSITPLVQSIMSLVLSVKLILRSITSLVRSLTSLVRLITSPMRSITSQV